MPWNIPYNYKTLKIYANCHEYIPVNLKIPNTHISANQLISEIGTSFVI